MFRYILIVLVFLITGLVLMSCDTAEQNPTQLFQEDFEKSSLLDTDRWEITRDGDFAEAVVDVFDVGLAGSTDSRLRLRANTIGTSDPLKYLGVRSKDTIDFSDGLSIAFDLDWNNQFNGCYLTSSLYLSPATNNNPKRSDDWLKFEYVGVPPGKNVRINIWENVNGLVHELHTDWGQRDDQGRPLGMALGHTSHRIEILLDKESLQVYQDGEEIYPTSKHSLNFSSSYLYLQMSSGTNYPSREVYFDNIVVSNTSPSVP